MKWDVYFNIHDVMDLWYRLVVRLRDIVEWDTGECSLILALS